MCGIAGIVAPDPATRAADIARRMGAAIAHRGPDEEGVASCGDGILVSRRLAIIDLEHGQQPMRDESGDILAVQNGEIYNFVGLRRELEGRGHRFITGNDTEVLPHAWEEWGTAMVQRLRGMFALAVWDARRGTLFLARDRFGKKPLVWADLPGGGIAFASEIQALLQHPDVERTIDPDAIDDYLTFGYVPAPRTAFAKIRKVEAAHWLLRTHDGLRSERYWRLSYEPKRDLTLDEAAAELRDRIDEAVRVRLMSDVPIGAFLSGGLDSSTVVAFMARHSPQPVRTFAIGFNDRAFDELAYARLVANAFGTVHEELIVDADQVDALPMLVRHLGEPFADSSIVPTYQVARITREHVTVALNGDGGDELFAGYERYRAATLASATLDRLPPVARRAVGRVASRVPESGLVPPLVRRARRFVSAVGADPEERYMRWSGYFTGPWRRIAFGEILRSRAARQDRPLAVAEGSTGAHHPAERFMAADVEMGLVGDLLVKMDIATMAASLEARSPLLDHELAEFVVQLPAAYKVSAWRSKVVLRHAMRDLLPSTTLARAKRGFTAPVGSWLRGPLAGTFRELVLARDARSGGFLDRSAIEGLFRDHVSGRADRTLLLWCVLMLELWVREVVEAPSGRRPLRVPLAVR